MRRFGKTLLAALAGFALTAGAGAAAASAIVENAKSQCIVGEQADGYIGVIDAAAASEDLKREVRAINQQRKAAYARLAERNGVTVEATAALTAEKLIMQAPSGHCVRDSSGQWKEVP